MRKIGMPLQKFKQHKKVLSIVLSILIICCFSIFISSIIINNNNIEINGSKQNSSITASNSTTKQQVPNDSEDYNSDVVDVVFDYLGENKDDYTVLSCVKSYKMAKEIGYEAIYMVTLEDNFEKSQFVAFVDSDSMELVDYYKIG